MTNQATTGNIPPKPPDIVRCRSLAESLHQEKERSESQTNVPSFKIMLMKPCAVNPQTSQTIPQDMEVEDLEDLQDQEATDSIDHILLTLEDKKRIYAP